jgi:hypothetical protein
MSANKWVKGTHPTTREMQRRLRKTTPRDTMLADFLRATTPNEKRQVIKNFAPHYFVFGEKLDPRNPYERNEYESEL